MSQSRPVLDWLRRPEYTGENRCTPCTVVNVVIAAVLAGVAAVVAVELAAAVFAVSLLAIYLRGYLVPYTPTLTTRYLPEPVLRALGKEPAPESPDAGETWEAVEKLEAHRENAVDVDAFLTDAGVVAPAENADGPSQYRLTEAFAERVDGHLADVREGGVDRAAVAALFDTDPEDVSGEDREYPAYEVGIRVRKWPSVAALHSDVAAHRALAEVTDDWLAVPADQRASILELLRGSRETCPDCGGALTETSEMVESCCVDVQQYAYLCVDCDTHLREYSTTTERAEKGLTGG
ncbi:MULTISPECIES: hypothetical protein [Salinibaculum]|uniref:hypothetical protein n=1 Tax=Salinibaculum TaxID=2732368 RepID=UPI0030CAB570